MVVGMRGSSSLAPRGESVRLLFAHDRRADQKPAPTDAVGQDPGEQLEDDQRRPLGQSEQAEVEWIPRQLPRDPREGDVLRPMAEDVENQSDPVEAVVPRLEGGERRGPTGRRRRARRAGL